MYLYCRFIVILAKCFIISFAKSWSTCIFCACSTWNNCCNCPMQFLSSAASPPLLLNDHCNALYNVCAYCHIASNRVSFPTLSSTDQREYISSNCSSILFPIFISFIFSQHRLRVRADSVSNSTSLIPSALQIQLKKLFHNRLHLLPL